MVCGIVARPAHQDARSHRQEALREAVTGTHQALAGAVHQAGAQVKRARADVGKCMTCALREAL
ncbi:hypothetical protein ACQPTN_43035 [Bradyrhizobium sp. 13971]